MRPLLDELVAARESLGAGEPPDEERMAALFDRVMAEAGQLSANELELVRAEVDVLRSQLQQAMGAISEELGRMGEGREALLAYHHLKPRSRGRRLFRKA